MAMMASKGAVDVAEADDAAGSAVRSVVELPSKSPAPRDEEPADVAWIWEAEKMLECFG